MPQLTFENAKPCGFLPCGLILHRRPTEGPKHWRERKSCSRSHGMLMRRPPLPTSKVCKVCGGTFGRPQSASHARWETQECCSKLCASRGVAGANRIPEEQLERKVCALDGCDVVFVRDPKHCTPSRWETRRFHSRGCADENARREAARDRAQRPKQDPKPKRAPRSRKPRGTRTEKPPTVDTQPVFAPPLETVWRPAAWAGRDIRPKIPQEA